jgi:hypothetical protein
MAVQTPETNADLQVTTLPGWERARWTDLSTDLRQFHVFPNLILFGKEKAEKAGKVARFETREGGTNFSFQLMMNHLGASSNVGMNPEDQPVDNDVMETGTAPWRWSTTQWFISRQAKMLNRGQYNQLNDYEKTKERAAMISLAVLMENNFWGAPVSATDDVTPYSLFTWLPKGSVAGFNGGFPSGFTTLGLDNEHSRWKHYVYPYTDLTPTDGIRATWLALTYTEFMNPVEGIPNLDAGVDRATYCNTPTYITMCEQVKLQNDSVGYDAGFAHGRPLLQGIPWFVVPKLDADTTDPIINLDWATMKCMALLGLWLARTEIPKYPGRHLSDAKFLDSGYNFVNVNRRKNSIGSKGTTYPA